MIWKVKVNWDRDCKEHFEGWTVGRLMGVVVVKIVPFLEGVTDACTSVNKELIRCLNNWFKLIVYGNTGHGVFKWGVQN